MKLRSKFEARVLAKLPAGTAYEPKQYKFPIQEPGYRCRGCGSKDTERTTSYTPDFLLPNGTYIEAKGRLTSANRRRLVAFRTAFPDVKVRIVYMANNFLYKGAKSRYVEWAAKAGFECCVGVSNIPPAWLA